MDEQGRDLFARSARAALSQPAGADLEAALDRLGWADALRDDPRTAVGIVFELAGEHGLGPPLDDVLAGVLCPGAKRGAAVLLPPFGRLDAPGTRRGGALVVRGMATARLARGGDLLVAVAEDGGVQVRAAPAASFDRRPIRGMDPALGFLEVQGTVDPAPGPGDDVAEAWRRALGLGQLALAHQLVGSARRMLALARDHAVERVQFGRPIAAFQAVRHRLADALVAVESAQASTEAAWELSTPFAATVAKAVAGTSARLVAQHAQQVLAGMGFTAEHSLHRYVKRVLVLDQMFGPAGRLTETIGAELLRGRALPPSLPL